MSDLKRKSKTEIHEFTFVDNGNKSTLLLRMQECDTGYTGELQVYNTDSYDTAWDVLEADLPISQAYELLNFIKESTFAKNELTVNFLEQAVDFFSTRGTNDLDLYYFAKEFKKSENENKN